MIKFILGKKIGMTRLYNDKGKAISATVIEAGPVFVTQVRDLNNKTAIQIGFDTAKHLNKPGKGHLEKNGIKDSLKHLKQYSLDNELAEQFKSGQVIKSDIFSIGDKVTVKGISKGKGFAGTVKRHNFNTGPKTHGSDNYRRPGSIGCAYPQRVFKGKKMAGHMGAENVSVRNLKIVAVEPEEQLIVVSGPVPGIKGCLLEIIGA